jgi:hypothetical protein
MNSIPGLAVMPYIMSFCNACACLIAAYYGWRTGSTNACIIAGLYGLAACANILTSMLRL